MLVCEELGGDGCRAQATSILRDQWYWQCLAGALLAKGQQAAFAEGC